MRATLMLLLTGCAASVDSPIAELPLGEPAPLLTLQTGWLASVSPALQADLSAFREREPGLFGGRVADSLVLISPDGFQSGALNLRFVGWGREGTEEALDLGAPVAGECSPGMAPSGDCIPRVERSVAGITEWWQGQGGAAEQGWDLEAAPPGAGPLSLVLELTGAFASASGEEAMIYAEDGRIWNYGAPVAWDAEGRPLAAWLEVEDLSIRVRVEDEGAVYPITVDPILTTASTTLVSTDYAYFGRAVAAAGDVNNDGYDDVIIGGYYYGYGNGAIYVYHGSSSGLSTTAATSIYSSSYDNFGYAVDRAGDVNGDGYDDVVVGAPYAASYAGRAYVYYGSSTGISSASYTTMSGPTATYSYYGRAVGGGGDVNNDGYADVVVGCYACSSYYGQAYVYHGGSAGISSSANTTLTSAYYAYFGSAVANDGDVNGDGYDDVLVGGFYYNYGYGSAFSYLGSATGVATSFNWGIANSAYSYLGFDVDYVGDTNGDGYDDVLLGGPYGNSYYGVAYLFQGTSTGLSATATSTLTSSTTYSYFGRSVAGLGDISGDGYLDIAVGAEGTNSVSVYEGTASGYSSSTSLTGTGYFGYAIDGAGDTNGDGRRELLVGSYADNSYYGGASLYSGDVDADGDGYGSLTDCNDADATINTGATEVLADGIDQNCNGGDACYRDGDRDGYGGSSSVNSSDLDCTDAGEATAYTDCNDSRSTVNPGVAETIANATDDNCDGIEYCYQDSDRDGYGTSATVASSDLDCADYGESTFTTDCDDASFYVSPGSTEVCDNANADEDCDGLADDQDSGVTAGRSTYYLDADQDGYGTTTSGLFCDLPTGYATNRTDCDDSNAGISPGDVEICDAANVDEDCDGYADDADVSASGEIVWYLDGDGDGYGLASSAQVLCDQPSGYVADNTDCADGDASINPGAPELCDGNNVDENCNGLADNEDAEASGGNPYYYDADGDGYGDSSLPGSFCDQAAGYVANGDDCDDNNAARSPGLPELCDAAELDEDCDGLADDADADPPNNRGSWWTDGDNDGYGDPATEQLLCNQPAGTVSQAGDCNDADVSIHEGMTELCDAADVDENCNGTADDSDSGATGQSTWYNDGDADGHGDPNNSWLLCNQPAGSQPVAGDCNDADATISPSAQEVCDEADTDEDCSGAADDSDSLAVGQSNWYNDGDLDGYGDPGSSLSNCNQPAGYLADATDCDDSNGNVNPSALEVCNELDDDCDGGVDDADPEGVPSDALTWYQDADQDGYGSGAGTTSCVEPPGSSLSDGDCNDADVSYNPSATEACDDPRDYNCDGFVGYEDADGDSYPACLECNDGDPRVNPGASEICNLVDDDCNGDVDGGAVDAPTWYADTDGDGFGDISVPQVVCLAPEAFVADNTDCADADAAVNPVATEICDDLDDNCDGVTDDDAVDRMTFYADADGDSYGDINTPVLSCELPENASTDSTDCDDTRGSVSPAQDEACGDDLDNNCSGAADEDCVVDSGDSGGKEDDSGDSGKDGGGTCGCSTGEPLGTAGLLLLGAALARRRRRS